MMAGSQSRKPAGPDASTRKPEGERAQAQLPPASTIPRVGARLTPPRPSKQRPLLPQPVSTLAKKTPQAGTAQARPSYAVEAPPDAEQPSAPNAAAILEAVLDGASREVVAEDAARDARPPLDDSGSLPFPLVRPSVSASGTGALVSAAPVAEFSAVADVPSSDNANFPWSSVSSFLVSNAVDGPSKSVEPVTFQVYTAEDIGAGRGPMRSRAAAQPYRGRRIAARVLVGFVGFFVIAMTAAAVVLASTEDPEESVPRVSSAAALSAAAALPAAVALPEVAENASDAPSTITIGDVDDDSAGVAISPVVDEVARRKPSYGASRK
ncbi:MAG TPA: hypothetical protein VM580_34945 [Labilithrix sp.]|nr:hypothetical protein [Labilithrix sp.]